MESGLSKYVPRGAAQPAHWGLLALGLAIVFSGATLIRPTGGVNCPAAGTSGFVPHRIVFVRRETVPRLRLRFSI